MSLKSIIRTLFILLGSLLGLALAAVLVLNATASNRLNKRYEIEIEPIAVPPGESARARGEHLVRAVSSCTSCHGPDLGGEEFINVPGLVQIYAPNLTTGSVGKASQYSREDWVRALRHGVDPNGRPLLFMPSQYFRYYNDADLGAIVAYIQSLPPVERETPARSLSLTGRTLLALGAFEEIPAEKIDHRSQPPQPPPEGTSPEYGEFLVTVATCKNCHGENLASGQVGPDDPPAPNLTPGGELAGWTEEHFLNLMRNGVHPTGRQIDPLMPWQSFRNMTDVELQAIWAYLQSLPPLPANQE